MSMRLSVLPSPACRLGESPLWDAASGSVYWIDVWGRALHRLSLADGARRRWDLPALPGCVLPGLDGSLLLALADGLVRFDPVTGTSRPVAHPEAERPGGRYNDGTVDPAGRVWVGSVESGAGRLDGALYRIDAPGRFAVIADGLATPNGIAFSPDRRTLYLTVTERRAILAYDYDEATGAVAERGPLVVDADCYPDGLVVAADGTLWSAKWDGWRVERYAPDGELLDRVEFPVPNVTSLTFAGPGLDRLVVTTASEDTARTRPGHEDDAGRLFVLDGVDTVGQPERPAETG